MTSDIPTSHHQIQTEKRISSIQNYLVCYQHIPRRHSRRWHTYLRSIGQRQMAGVYLVETRKRTLKTLIELAHTFTQEKGTISLYPLCKRCTTQTLHIGGQPSKINQPYIII